MVHGLVDLPAKLQDLGRLGYRSMILPAGSTAVAGTRIRQPEPLVFWESLSPFVP